MAKRRLALFGESPFQVGHVVVYENIAVFDPKGKWALGKRLQKQAGEKLGTVKALIKVDPYCVLYQRLTHRPSFLKRHPEARGEQTRFRLSGALTGKRKK